MLLFVYYSVIIIFIGHWDNDCDYTFNRSTLLAFKKDIESSTKGDQERRVIHIHIHIHQHETDDKYGDEWNSDLDTDTDSDPEGNKHSDSD